MVKSIPRQVYVIWAPVLGIAFALFVYGLFLFRHAMNVPFSDDIPDVLQFITGLLHSENLGDSFDLLMVQHNDHRTAASRLFYYLVYRVEGEVNFFTLTLLANAALPLILMMFYFTVRDHPYRWWLLLPAALLLFQLRAYGITLWSMAAFAYFYVYFYGFAALICLHRVSVAKFLLAIVCATLATFTLASGQVVWVMGLVSLLHQCFVLKRINFVYPVVWALVTVLMLVAWRAGLDTPNSMVNVLTSLLSTPGHHILFFFSLLGNVISEQSVALAAGCGALMLLVLVYSTFRNAKHTSVVLELLGWYIVLSTFAMTLGRAPFSTVEYALSSRYSFPSIVMLATTALLIMLRARALPAPLILIPVLLAGVYSSNSYRIYSQALQPHIEKRVNKYNRKRYWVYGQSAKETNAIVKEAIALDVYVPPARPLPKPTIYTAVDK